MAWKVEHPQGVHFDGGPLFIVRASPNRYYVAIGVLEYDRPKSTGNAQKEAGFAEIECLFNNAAAGPFEVRKINDQGHKPPRCRAPLVEDSGETGEAMASDSGGGQAGDEDQDGGEGQPAQPGQPGPEGEPPGGPPGPPKGPPRPPPPGPPGVQTEPPGVQTSP